MITALFGRHRSSLAKVASVAIDAERTLIGLQQQVTSENLRRLHRKHVLSIDGADHKMVPVGDLQCFSDRRGQSSSAMFHGGGEHSLNFLHSNQRSRRIVHRNEICVRNRTQAGAH